jgi:hypothetical protein
MVAEQVRRPRQTRRWLGAPRTAAVVGVAATCLAVAWTAGPVLFGGAHPVPASPGVSRTSGVPPLAPTLAVAASVAAHKSETTGPAILHAHAAAAQPAHTPHPASRVVSTTAPPTRDRAPAPGPGSASVAVNAHPGWGCVAALAYLQQHANPAFRLECPGYAEGHQAMTCSEVAGICPASSEIVIAVPCPAAYENEAWNSWHLTTGPIDPYGSCPDLS